MQKIQRALISVSDKTGIIEFAKTLAKHNIEIISTGGTHKTLADAGLSVKDISEVTNFPEMMDGRVKTLHPKVHGGLLAVRNNKEHLKAMQDHNIENIDLVIINLYPFEKTLAAKADFSTVIENIDIGGPAMIRSAAKNYKYVGVITEISDYKNVVEELDSNAGALSEETKSQLAAKAFARTAAYDAAISGWLVPETKTEANHYAVGGQLKQKLRYGENPHQKAAFYVNDANAIGVANAVQLQGKELSYNNINDTDSAFKTVSEFEKPAIAIIKHANPCGVAEDNKSLAKAYVAAFNCDNISAFGGIIAANREIDEATAVEISKIFSEVIIAPKISDKAKEIFAKKKNLRVLETGKMPEKNEQLQVKSVSGGLLTQTVDNIAISREDLNFVTKRQPTEQEIQDMLFGFKVCRHVKSNAIVVVENGRTIGIGAGQTSRVDSSRIACSRISSAAENTVLASDAFFPFADGVEAAAKAGVKAIIQPGGSVRDEEVIAEADKHNIAMAFCGIRTFYH